MTEPPRQDGAMLVLTIGWFVLGAFLAFQGNWVGVLACLAGGGIMGATLVYTRRRRGSNDAGSP
ncbi:MAG: hypothetical protein M3P93_09940 [Actinomycetota bacterium]|nr:hypothetical protein [Actinomycetota bacterium]